MLDIVLPALAALLALGALAVSALVLGHLRRLEAALGGGADADATLARLVSLDEGHARAERAAREDFRAAREENVKVARALREEVSSSVDRFGEGLTRRLAEVAGTQRTQFEGFAEQLRQSAADSAGRLKETQEDFGRRLALINEASVKAGEALKGSVEAQLASQRTQLDAFATQLRQGAAESAQRLKESQEDFGRRLAAIDETNAKAGEALKTGIEAQLKTLRQENEAKLEQMRATVDEKLQGTLEQRLGESFKLVSERLEAVHKGLGEMQSLATGVGDLKRVLTNVKSRGTWGEVQLGALLEQMLAPGQFATNVSTGGKGGERVEYAIRLPGHEDGSEVLLPLDAKFPIEDYERLQAASDSGDLAAVEAAAKALEIRVRGCARDICEKYLNPPTTTDFGILFLPTEGLYAEVIRRPGLCDDLQRSCRVTVAGPTTLTAILSSLQMGFRTLAIQKRSGEVWQVLGGVKAEFGKFGPVLEKVKKKLQEATNHIDAVDVRKRAIDRKLRGIEMVEIGATVPAALDFIGVDDEDGEDGQHSPFVEAAQ
ncbi:DNA recombination protein RmuC [Aureimonas leprariae]|uniref:DNA recombination protein RmuC homolog n=1 Tax=Plantimonas leprariae TaxID=2615207 RepID=A0A7V7PR99_9HYPH|nr:DNA recombination protein RmuC [Aureimonas leprariae]KAB0681230.1 DNA recombination protein RmuC [Aureimonas leprariae]